MASHLRLFRFNTIFFTLLVPLIPFLNATDHQTTENENKMHNDFYKILNESIRISENLKMSFQSLIEKTNEMYKLLKNEKEQYDKLMNMSKIYEVSMASDIIKLNVGGTLFSTIKSTLDQKIKKDGEDGYYDPNYLQLLVSGLIKPSFDENKAIFIDRDPQYFRYIIDYLRTVKSGKEFKLPELNTWDLSKLKIEAEFYQLHGLVYLFQPKSKFDDCKILTKSQAEEFFQLCKFKDSVRWKLIYRATRDGFGSNIFHDRCDNIPNTLTIIKTSNNYIFGGFVSVTWDSISGYKSDSNAFIFTLVNHVKKPLIFKNRNDGRAIYCGSWYGPTFGGGHDFFISSNANSNTQSTSNLGSSYYAHDITPSTTLLTETYNFQVAEIEVFRVTFIDEL